MSKYKRLDACPKTFLITYHNEAIDDAQLQVYEYPANNSTEYGYTLYAQGNMPGTPKDVYLGYEDINKIFDGNLSSEMTAYSATLDSDVTGCSAKLSRADTTGALIKYSLNKCTADRIITFSYNKLPIFSIKQTYDNSGNIISQTIYVCSVSGTANGFALFDTNQAVGFSMSTYGNQINAFMPYYSNQNIFVLVYTEEKMLMYNGDKIGTLLDNYNLRHLSGNDYLTKPEYKDLYLDYVSNVNHFEQGGIGNGTFSTTKITFDMDIYVYINKNNSYYLSQTNTFNFNNLESNNHLGVYELRSTI